MPLDPDTQYYALAPSDAGAQPAAAPEPDPDLTGPIMDPPPSLPPAMLALVQQLSADTTGNGKGSKSAPLVPAAGSTAKLAPTLSPVVQAAAAQLMSNSSMGNPAPSTQPQLAADPAAMPAAAPSMTDAAGNSVPAAPSVPPSGPAPLTMPQMPKHNDTALKIIGALAALSGGSGGKVLGAYADARNAHDVQTYNQQVQAFQQQQKDTQQATDNQYQQADNASKFTEQLAKMDPATQEATIRNLTPAEMAANGFTTEQVQKQFFGPDGKFLPVSAADKPTNPVALARAQTAARTALSQLSVKDQQAQHDAYATHQDDWVQQTGMPYDNFTPITTTKSTIAAATLAEKVANDGVAGAAKTSDAQNNQLKTLISLGPAMRLAIYQSYAGNPKAYEAKYGTSYAAGVPGGTQANETAALATTNKEADAKRTAQVRQLSQQQQAHYQQQMTRLKAEGLNIQQAHNVAMEQVGRENAATSRLRANAAQSGGSTGGGIRALQAQMRGAPTAASYQSAINTANTTKNHILANAHDKDGNQIPLTPFQESVVDSANNSILQAQHGQRALAHGVNPITGQQIAPSVAAAKVQFGGGGPMRPAPVALNGRTLLPRTSPLSGPPAPPLPSRAPALPALRAQMRQPARIAAPGPLTPQERAGMSNSDFARYFAQRMAIKLGGH